MKSNFAVLAALTIFSITSQGVVTPQGFILYTDPPSPYVNGAEFTSYANTNAAYCIITKTNGASEQVYNSGVIGIVNYPAGQPDATVATQALHSIQNLQRQCPQPEFRAYLQAAYARWQNALAACKTRQMVAAAAENNRPKSTAPSISLEVNGTKYDDVTLTNVEDELASITNSGGVTRIPVKALSKEQIAVLNKTSTTAKILTESEFLYGISSRAQNPKEFVAFLAKDSHRFPLTSFCYALESRTWDRAERIATAEIDALCLGLATLSYAPAVTKDENKPIPILLTVAAQAKNGNFDAANGACNRIKPLGWRAFGMRITEEWALTRGNYEKAKWECFLLHSAIKSPAEVDLAERDSGDNRGVFGTAESADVQRAAAFEEIVRELARVGQLGVARSMAMNGNDHNDISYLANVTASLVKAEILAGKSQAGEEANTISAEIQDSDSGGYWRRLIFESEAQGFAKVGDWESTEEVLDSAMKSVEGDESQPVKMRLFLEKALLYERSGNVEKKDRYFQQAFDSIDSDHINIWTSRTQEVRWAIALDRQGAKIRFDELRKALGGNSRKSVDDRIFDLVAFARWQTEADNIEQARSALNDAAVLLGSNKDVGSRVGDVLAEGQAACGLLGSAMESLLMVRDAIVRIGAKKKIAAEQAKQHRISDALSILKPDAYTMENVDLIGAAVILGIEPLQPELDTSYKELPF